MKTIRFIVTSIFITIGYTLIAQIPQNVNPGKGRDESIWESQSALLIVLGIIVVLVITRNWSKRIHKKRDDLTRSKNEEKEKNDVTTKKE